MPVSIRLHPWTRQGYIERHDFYVDQGRRRLLSQFDDIERDAERFADEEFDRLSEFPILGELDDEDAAHLAWEAAAEHLQLLEEMRKQTLLAIIAGMYHQWEKGLREFIWRQLQWSLEDDAASKFAWGRDHAFGLLDRLGWDTSGLSFRERIDACRLIVNVYKHGMGASFRQLRDAHPEFIHVPDLGVKTRFSLPVTNEHLVVSDDQFDDLAGAIREFWVEIPGLLWWD